MPNKQSVQNFSEKFLATIQGIQKRKQEQDEFNREMQFRNRQMNLLNTRFESEQDRLKSQFEATHGLNIQKEATDVEQFGVGQEFKERNLLEATRQFDVGQETKVRGQNITASRNQQLAQQHSENLQFKYDALEIGAALDKLKQQTDTEGSVTRSKHIAKLIGDINFRIEGGGDDTDENLKGNIEELLEFTNLKQESEEIRTSLDEGANIDQAIGFINEDRKKGGFKELTADEIKYLKLFGLAEDEL